MLLQFCGMRDVRKCKAMAIYLTLACALTIPAHATTIMVSDTNDNGRLIAQHS